MTKVIVSHDVDHLFARDHWFRDLIYPKIWVRTTLQFLKQQISAKEWWLRNTSCFRKNRHNIDALMEFDKQNGIPSTFFFGMKQGLGMSYKPEEAKSIIMKVHDRGFSVGVHGIEYQDIEGMEEEYHTFQQLTGFDPCGIRMHYVRFTKDTFEKLNNVGYAFDTTEFNKQDDGTRKAPYRIGKMWEFPLAIMDVYLPQTLKAAKQRTLELLDFCKTEKLEYITVLFHDYQFCNDYCDMKNWYIWLVDYFVESKEYEFISYEKAIEELKEER